MQAKARARGRDGDAVLTSTGLGDNAGLAEPLGETRLPDGIVDLMRASVVEVLALEVKLEIAAFRAQPYRVVKRSRASDLPCQKSEKFSLK